MPTCIECEKEGKKCTKGVFYGDPARASERTAAMLRCKKHKLEIDRDLRQNYCKNCPHHLQANYGTELGKPIHCAQCRLPEEFRVLGKRCVNIKEDGNRCTELAVKAKLGPDGVSSVKEFCKDCCPKEGYTDASHKKCVKCNKMSRIWGVKGGVATHCFECKEPHFVNLVSKFCETCILNAEQAEEKRRAYTAYYPGWLWQYWKKSSILR